MKRGRSESSPLRLVIDGHGDHEKRGGKGTINENVRPTLSLLRATFYILPPKSKDNFLIVEMAFSNLIRGGGGRRQLYKLQDFLTKYP
jgi:hypothetical protein